MYDPAARGYLVDANPPDRQGETFGLYGAAQMGGLMLGPAIGGLVAAATGNPTSVFWIAGIFVFAAGLLVWARVREIPRGVHDGGGRGRVRRAAPTESRSPGRPGCSTGSSSRRSRSASGSYFAGGTYEVVWSLYLTSLGAGWT